MKTLSPIIPISHHYNQDNSNINEFDTPYKSFQDEFFSMRDEFHSFKSNNISRFTNTQHNRKKIFDSLERQEQPIAQQKLIVPKAINFNPLIFLQTKQIPHLSTFKDNCFNTDICTKSMIYSNKYLKVEQLLVSFQHKSLQIQLKIYNLSPTKDLKFLDFQFYSDSTLNISKSEYSLNSLKPLEDISINMEVQIRQLPFTFINVSMSYNNNQFERFVLPITIFNFGQLKQQQQQQELNQYVFVNEMAIKINQAASQIEKLIGRQFQFKLMSEVGSLSINKDQYLLKFSCSSNDEEINTQILNSLVFLSVQ